MRDGRPGPEIREYPTAAEVAEALARFLVEQLKQVIADRGGARVALAGGRSPASLYRRLGSSDQVEWGRADWYFGDERCVPPDSERSNYRMVRETLLAAGNVSPRSVHRIRGELGAARAARDYGARLGDRPLDIALLGMGEDGHVASLAPGLSDLRGETRSVVPIESPAFPEPRVSLSLRAINRSAVAVLLITGSHKAERLARVFCEVESGAPDLPAALVRPESGRLVWFVDREAGREIPLAAKRSL